MTNADSIQPTAVTGVNAFPQALLNIPELEKVSCSIRGKSLLHPLALMGKRIRNAQLVHACNVDGYPFAPASSIDRVDCLGGSPWQHRAWDRNQLPLAGRRWQ